MKMVKQTLHEKLIEEGFEPLESVAKKDIENFLRRTDILKNEVVVIVDGSAIKDYLRQANFTGKPETYYTIYTKRT